MHTEAKKFVWTLDHIWFTKREQWGEEKKSQKKCIKWKYCTKIFSNSDPFAHFLLWVDAGFMVGGCTFYNGWRHVSWLVNARFMVVECTFYGDGHTFYGGWKHGFYCWDSGLPLSEFLWIISYRSRDIPIWNFEEVLQMTSNSTCIWSIEL